MNYNILKNLTRGPVTVSFKTLDGTSTYSQTFKPFEELQVLSSQLTQDVRIKIANKYLKVIGEVADVGTVATPTIIPEPSKKSLSIVEHVVSGTKKSGREFTSFYKKDK